MKPTELRLGNLTSAGVVTEINADCFYVHDGESSLKSAWFDIKPIPLTEEWLLKLGFESNAYQDRYENKVIHIECNKLRGATELWIDRMPHIKHVHQLQNLYHAITGQELEVDLTNVIPTRNK